MNTQQQEPFSYFYYEDFWNLRKRHQEPEKRPPPGLQGLTIQPPVYQMFPQSPPGSPVYYYYGYPTQTPPFYHFYGPPVYNLSPRSDLDSNSPPYSPRK